MMSIGKEAYRFRYRQHPLPSLYYLAQAEDIGEGGILLYTA
ncbi:hypothetical protein [Yersinia pekkanenii]|nr:hypothetical protein [Yersinia pekkanenii]